MAIATFAAGCFWHVEEVFRHVKGVLKTAVGYTGGATENPTYEQVCSDKTGHAEAIEIEYDPKQVSYEELLKVFWELHDPTTWHRQGPDVGSQYRSAIFYHTPDQEKAAQKSLKDQQSRFSEKIVTEIKPAGPFYKAETYHQCYLAKKKGK